MSQREENLKEYLNNQGAVHEILVAQGMEFLDADDIWTILQSELELEYSEVLHAKLSGENILDIVVRHVNRNGLLVGKIMQQLSEDSIIWYPIISDKLEKANVRNNGQLWVIHLNDADPFPSLPHAHDYQNNLKLNLYDGTLYSKKTAVGKMKKKELAELVAKIKKDHPNIVFKNNL